MSGSMSKSMPKSMPGFRSKLRSKLKKTDWESRIIIVFLFVMAIYYGWRLFALTPWYDELYTYYYFISRGPVYAAIHWPLPNNHVGYSVLSALLDLSGNSAIGLRGISWLASLISLCLLFAIGRLILKKGYALAPVFIFASMEMVNSLAVQGRGYALASCLYLAALYGLIRIAVFKSESIINYLIIGCSFIWGLYTLPSSVYYVIPLCFTGGIWLLMQRRIKELVKLFAASIISAVCTTGLYSIIWLAIGSNLLSKTAGSAYYGLGHVSIITKAPFKAMRTGIEYMLDTPYIQSVGRDGYMTQFAGWLKALFENYYAGLSIPLLIIVCIGLIIIAGRMIVYKKMRSFTELYLLVSFALTPLMLIAQASLPYYRVFSFFAVPVSMMIIWLCSGVGTVAKRTLKAEKSGFGLFSVWVCITCALILIKLLPQYNNQYGDREAAIQDALEKIELKEDDIICVTDCDQEYLVKYIYDTDNITYIPQEADYIVFDNKLFLPENIYAGWDSSEEGWKLYMNYDDVPRAYLDKETEIYYENDRCVIFAKKGEIGNEK